MLKIALLFIFPFQLSLLVWAVPAPHTKKNLCTITINSSQEVESFKKHLAPADWNFTELTPAATDPETNNWFHAACLKKISCDVLVISGHFGGTFFGNTKFKLPIEELEENSCDSDCSGILNQPKEVFLFGCNTLASKEKDSRSPEEYMQVLLNDGFSVSQASQIVSFRYSGFGDSFKTRMSSVFAKTPSIYGFSSIGPSGASVSSMLDSYLTSSLHEYRNFESYVQRPPGARNEKLFTSLKATSLAQATGLYPNLLSIDEKPYCYIRSKSVDRLTKINYVEKLFASGQALQMIYHIEEFIHDLKKDQGHLSEDETAVLDRLSKNQKMKADLISLLQLKGEIYIPLKVHVLNTLKDLDVISSEFLDSAFNQLIDLKTPFTTSRQEMLCASNFSLNIPLSVIPDERWNELPFLVAMTCLKPKATELQSKFLEKFSDEDINIRATAIWFFYGATVSTQVELALAKKAQQDPTDSVRLSAATVLRDMKSTNHEVQTLLANAIIHEKSEYVFQALTAATIVSRLPDDIYNYLLENTKNSNYPTELEKFLDKKKDRN